MRHIFRVDDMDLFEMVNHFFNREREVIQNPLAPVQNRWKFPTPIPIKNNVRHFEVPFTL